MFCKNCGKEIGNSNFCQYCGNANEKATNLESFKNDLLVTVRGKIKSVGHGKMMKYVGIISLVLNSIIRIICNEIEVVYHALAQDDYYAVSEEGRKYMIIVLVIQIVIGLFIFWDSKKERLKISSGDFTVFALLLIIQFIAMVLKVPAPY